MRHYGPATTGDVIRCRGAGNAPGAGVIISTVIVTDPAAKGYGSGKSGYECRDATPAEIKAAGNRIKETYG